jgi:hypothetical protein
MYARLHKSTAPDLAGATEVFTLHRLAGADDLVLSLWPTFEEASADPTAEWYELEGDKPGGDREAAPRIAAVVSFETPLSEPRLAAMRRANDERIGPLMVDHPGTVRSLVLWQPERRRMAVVVLAVSVEAIEDGQRQIMASKLLPGEDAALLQDPERVDLYRVVESRVEVPS